MANRYNTEGMNFSLPAILGNTFNTLFGDSDIQQSLDETFDDNAGIVNKLWNDITGKTAQQREFEQQEYLQDKQNAYNTPAAQMQRLKAAGFSNAQAAQSVLGGQAVESAQAPVVSNATGAAAAGVGAVAQGLQSGSQVALNDAQRKDLLAGAAEKTAHAATMDTLREAEKNLLINQGAHELVKMGLTAAQSQLLAAKVVYADQNERLDIYAKMANLGKVNKEIKVLEEDYKKRKAEVAILGEEQKQAEIDTWFAQERQRVYQESGFDMNSPFDMALLEMDANGHGSDVEDFVYNRSYQGSRGTLQADSEYVYNNSYKAEEGKLDAQAVKGYEAAYQQFKAKIDNDKNYAAFFNELEKNKLLFKLLADLYFGSDGSLGSVANRFVSLFASEFHLDTKEIESIMRSYSVSK